MNVLEPVRGVDRGVSLSREETARRVRAARELAGLEQFELGELMVRDGFGRHDPGRLERADSPKPPPAMTPARIASLAKHTGLPPSFFTEPLVADLFQSGGEAPAEDQTLGDELASLKTEVRVGLSEVRIAQEEILQRLERVERGQADSDS